MFYLYDFGDYPATFRWNYDRFFHDRWCREAVSALASHPDRTLTPESADLFVVSATLRSVPFAGITPKSLQAMWDELTYRASGRRHVAFDLRDDPWPLFPGRDVILCKSALHRNYYQADSMIPIPQFPRYRFTAPFLPARQRRYLASFKGNLRTSCTDLRQQLLRLHDDRTFPIESAVLLPQDIAISEDGVASERVRPGESSYADMLYNSTFALLPRGCGYALSYRMIECMNAGCVPVIISDGYVLPFEELLDYHRFSIRIREADVLQLPDLLRERWSEADELQARAYEVYRAHFSSTERILSTTMRIASSRGRGAAEGASGRPR